MLSHDQKQWLIQEKEKFQTDGDVSNRDKLLEQMETIFPIDDYGAAGIYGCSKYGVDILVSGSYMSVHLKSEKSRANTKSTAGKVKKSKEKILQLALKEFGFMQVKKSHVYFSQALQATMTVKDKTVEFNFSQSTR